MTNETLNQTIYVVIDGEIEPMTYRDYLKTFDDEDKLYVKEITADYYRHKYSGEYLEESEYNEKMEWEEDFKPDEWEYFGENTKHYELYMRSPSQFKNGKTDGWQFDDEEQAELEIFERTANWISEKNWDAPQWFYTEQAADAEIIESIATCYEIDNEVAAHIYRKEKIVNAIRADRETTRRAKVTAENEARKAYLATAVPAEAAAITIDEKFIDDLKEAENLTKKDKANRHASALKGLLERHGKEKIESDFWQVFRILKAQAKI